MSLENANFESESYTATQFAYVSTPAPFVPGPPRSRTSASGARVGRAAKRYKTKANLIASAIASSEDVEAATKNAPVAPDFTSTQKNDRVTTPALCAIDTQKSVFLVNGRLTAPSHAIAAPVHVQAALPNPAEICPASGQKSENLAKPSSSIASQKERFVAGLVGASVLAIEAIWGCSSSPLDSMTETNALPLHWFVKEVLRRSRTSCSTLQVALYYLHKSRREIRDMVAKAERVRLEVEMLRKKAFQAAENERQASTGLLPLTGNDMSLAYPSPPLSPVDTSSACISPTINTTPLSTGLNPIPTTVVDHDDHHHHLLLHQQIIAAQSNPVLCGRRMFLAALISASKYLQDRNYSNKAWSRISGLPISEVNLNERSFLNLVGFSLHLRSDDFHKWTERLSSLVIQGAVLESVTSSSDTKEQAALHMGLARSASEYSPDPESLQDLAAKSTAVLQAVRNDVGRSATIQWTGTTPISHSTDQNQLVPSQLGKISRSFIDLPEDDCGAYPPQPQKTLPSEQLMSPAPSQSSEEEISHSSEEEASHMTTTPSPIREVRALPHRYQPTSVVKFSRKRQLSLPRSNTWRMYPWREYK